MIQDSSPITPPPELVEKWANHSASIHRENGTYAQHEFMLATQAARWGADQELEACCEWLEDFNCSKRFTAELRIARRPKPPSLKELNLKHLEVMERDGHYLPEIIADLRRAIESLPS